LAPRKSPRVGRIGEFLENVARASRIRVAKRGLQSRDIAATAIGIRKELPKSIVVVYTPRVDRFSGLARQMLNLRDDDAHFRRSAKSADARRHVCTSRAVHDLQWLIRGIADREAQPFAQKDRE
jgi:hypothetical protein